MRNRKWRESAAKVGDTNAELRARVSLQRKSEKRNAQRSARNAARGREESAAKRTGENGRESPEFVQDALRGSGAKSVTGSRREAKRLRKDDVALKERRRVDSVQSNLRKDSREST